LVRSADKNSLITIFAASLPNIGLELKLNKNSAVSGVFIS